MAIWGTAQLTDEMKADLRRVHRVVDQIAERRLARRALRLARSLLQSGTLTRLDIRSGRVRGEIDVPINPYEIAAYGNALWITCLADGRIARVTNLDG